MVDTSTWLAMALWELKARSSDAGLIIDSSAAEALQAILEAALADVERIEGPGALNDKHRAAFSRTARRLAEEASDAARNEGGSVLAGRHIEHAAGLLRNLRYWPFIEG